MKIAALIARILLGLIFVVFGLNGFLNFIPMGPMPTGTAGQFFWALSPTHFFFVVAVFPIVCGGLFLFNRHVAPGLLIFIPGVVYIIFFFLLIAPNRLP